VKEVSKHGENRTAEYEVTSHSPGDLADGDLGACIAIIQCGGAVDPESADEELGRSEVIAIARKEANIVGVGAIKRLRTGYASTIASSKKSGSYFDPNTPELGYVAVDAQHQKRGLSHRIVAELLSRHQGRLFATTFNEGMKKTLADAGFVRKGREWRGQKHNQLSLWIKE
jgi:RimJ/RimL family protein N-acetyltransferase